MICKTSKICDSKEITSLLARFFSEKKCLIFLYFCLNLFCTHTFVLFRAITCLSLIVYQKTNETSKSQRFFNHSDGINLKYYQFRSLNAFQ